MDSDIITDILQRFSGYWVKQDNSMKLSEQNTTKTDTDTHQNKGSNHRCVFQNKHKLHKHISQTRARTLTLKTSNVSITLHMHARSVPPPLAPDANIARCYNARVCVFAMICARDWSLAHTWRLPSITSSAAVTINPLNSQTGDSRAVRAAYSHSNERQTQFKPHKPAPVKRP